MPCPAHVHTVKATLRGGDQEQAYYAFFSQLFSSCYCQPWCKAFSKYHTSLPWPRRAPLTPSAHPARSHRPFAKRASMNIIIRMVAATLEDQECPCCIFPDRVDVMPPYSPY